MTDGGVARYPYDEFSMFHENAAEFSIPYAGPPVVRRDSVPLGDGRRISALVWGQAEPELVFLHGGAQNAHTWDTVALALDRPLVALDLPGHGHSDGFRDGVSDLAHNADDVAAAVRALAPEARAVVGMSMGGATLAAVRPSPRPRAPGGPRRRHPRRDPGEGEGHHGLHPGAGQLPRLRRHPGAHGGVQPHPHGVLAAPRDPPQRRTAGGRHLGVALCPLPAPLRPTAARPPGFVDLWEVVSGLGVPLMLVRGMRPQSVVDDADEAELLRRRPDARVEHVEGAGHSVQGDEPVELARLIADFVD